MNREKILSIIWLGIKIFIIVVLIGSGENALILYQKF